ncbi:MAG: RsmD family RNA methyltransferase [Nitrospinae bacterium]|nr:RsmD family RNA methyltransferase [Nitrospinota bacterium]
MRIISGKFKGITIKSGKVPGVKPTQGNIREAFFNIIAATTKFEEKSFLDMFAGFGGNGLEAMSRGAKVVTFLDKSPAAVKFISQNILDIEKKTGIKANAYILKDDVFTGFKKLERRKIAFDILFLDPPYDTDLVREVVLYLLRSYKKGKGLLNNDFVLGAEWEFKRNEEFLADINALKMPENMSIENRKYGSHSLLIIRGGSYAL